MTYIQHVVGRMLGQFRGQFGAFLGTLGNQELRTPSMSAKPQLLEALFRVNHPFARAGDQRRYETSRLLPWLVGKRQ
jgi:hypothetical protein